MRRYLLNRRSDARIMLRSEHVDDTDPLIEPQGEKKIDSTVMAPTISSILACKCPHADVRRITNARSMIKYVVLGIWIWHLLIWITMPTKVYKKSWQPVIRDMTKTIYFGVQGTGILLNMMPVFLVAVLGCVYLHLGNRINQSRLQQKARRDRNVNKVVWKKPCLVKGPLGIVSRTELAFLVMFIILLIWSFANYLHRGLDKINKVVADGEPRSLILLESLALWLALVGNVCLALMFFPMTRVSSILPLFGLTSESSVRYHIWLGHIGMCLFTAHGALFILYWFLTDDLLQMLKWDMVKVSNVAGEIALLAGILMWITTLPRIREKKFELFFYTHHLYIVFIVFFMLHVGINFALMMLPGFYLFVIDRFLRLLQSQQRVKLISARVLPCKSVELNFAKSPGLKYQPSSYMFVNIPSISKLQWHPFTVCSDSDLEPDSLSVVIKAEGSWSLKLHQILSASPSIEHLPLSIEGPYGPAETHFLRYDMIVMVSGGSGITPFISIIRSLMHSRSNARKTPKVVFVCAFKTSSDLKMLDLLLPLSCPPSASLPNLDIQIEAYVTREQEPSKETSRDISTVLFKPKNSDTHILPTLGPNSWLWLALIISASFLISLILIGFVTKVFIYPIDKNTDKIYPRPFKTIIYILSFCSGIVLASSAAFLWNKQKNAKDANQVNNTVVHTSESSSGSINSSDLELENLLLKILTQVTNVHYGARPDLRKILSECTGSSTGVFACGPKGMLNDVAAICSSDLTGNIHFEFVSFSW